jgi:hypothetical protein
MSSNKVPSGYWLQSEFLKSLKQNEREILLKSILPELTYSLTGLDTKNRKCIHPIESLSVLVQTEKLLLSAMNDHDSVGLHECLQRGVAEIQVLLTAQQLWKADQLLRENLFEKAVREYHTINIELISTYSSSSRINMSSNISYLFNSAAAQLKFQYFHNKGIALFKTRQYRLAIVSFKQAVVHMKFMISHKTAAQSMTLSATLRERYECVKQGTNQLGLLRQSIDYLVICFIQSTAYLEALLTITDCAPVPDDESDCPILESSTRFRITQQYAFCGNCKCEKFCKSNIKFDHTTNESGPSQLSSQHFTELNNNLNFKNRPTDSIDALEVLIRHTIISFCLIKLNRIIEAESHIAQALTAEIIAQALVSPFPFDDCAMNKSPDILFDISKTVFSLQKSKEFLLDLIKQEKQCKVKLVESTNSRSLSPSVPDIPQKLVDVECGSEEKLRGSNPTQGLFHQVSFISSCSLTNHCDSIEVGRSILPRGISTSTTSCTEDQIVYDKIAINGSSLDSAASFDKVSQSTLQFFGTDSKQYLHSSREIECGNNVLAATFLQTTGKSTKLGNNSHH